MCQEVFNVGICHEQNCDYSNVFKEILRGRGFGCKDADLVVHAAVLQILQINEAKRLGYEVSILETQNVCEVVNQNPSIKEKTERKNKALVGFAPNGELVLVERLNSRRNRDEF